MFALCYFISIASTFCVDFDRVFPPPAPEPVAMEARHYPEVLEAAVEMITRYEGFRPEAYKDTLGWSIGYGTKSYPGEVITEKEAFRRMLDLVQDGVYRVQRDFPDLPPEAVVAMTSLYYNCWRTGYLRVKKEGFDVMLEEDFCNKQHLPWLTKRRAEERMLIFASE